MAEIVKRAIEGKIVPKSRYVHVRDEQRNGSVKIYVDSQDETNTTGIAISRARTFDRGDETMIFLYDLKNNKVAHWGELYAGYGEDHETALRNFESEQS